MLKLPDRDDRCRLDDVVYLRAGTKFLQMACVGSESLDIDESLITGEADPVYKPLGLPSYRVLSGCRDGYFRITGVGHDFMLPS